MVLARLALSSADFDAYGVENAAFSRPRIDLERRALGWARTVAARLADLGLVVEFAGPDELASLRGEDRADRLSVRFSRAVRARAEVERAMGGASGRTNGAAVARAPTRHASLTLRLDASGVLVCFAAPPAAEIDLENFRARRASDPDRLVAAILALPEEFTIGADSSATVHCSEASAALLDGLDGGLWIGWRVARETAIEHAELLDDQLADALVALAPLYRLVSWSRDDDLVGLDQRIVGARRGRSKAASRPALLDRSDRAAAGVEPSPSSPLAAAGRRDGGSVEKGARVRVRSGPFADKVGTVSELDGRGAARVMLGLLSSRFELAELELVVEGRDRRAFQSSHRRPLPPAPRKAR